jgi:hypothetical protein
MVAETASVGWERMSREADVSDARRQKKTGGLKGSKPVAVAEVDALGCSRG